MQVTMFFFILTSLCLPVLTVIEDQLLKCAYIYATELA